MFTAFVKRHEPGLFRFILGLVGCVEDAEDIAQETLLRVYRSDHRLRVTWRESAGANAASLSAASDLSAPAHFGDARFGRWLYTIARNLSIDHLRRKRERAVPGEQLAHTLSNDPSPDSLFERADEIDRLRNALERLPRHYRDILDLRFTEGLSYKRIANRLGVPIPTVETRLHRARRMLRRIFRD